MAAGLGFKTFAVGEILSAANVNGYLMQGVLVFADATARDAAITSPQEGQFAYLKDTNVTTYYTGSAWANLDTTGMTNPMTTTGDTIYSSSGSTPARLGIGTAGQVLQVNSGATAPEWATPAASGSRGLNQIIPTSVAVGSGTATVGTNGMITCTTVGGSISVNGCFSSTYTNYLVLTDAIYTSTYSFFDVRLRASGTDNSTASSYVWESLRVSDASVSGSRLTANRFQDALTLSQSVSGNQIHFYKPFVAAKTGMAINADVLDISGAYIWNGTGTHNQSTSYDGFSIIDTNQQGGGQTFTGKIRIYGWQE
jgi:hypothetical protein